MTDILKPVVVNNDNTPQCKYFVVRKKRLCRMTVRPGRQYCGEHEPDPRTDEGKNDTRIPCPNDPKHTCYASKLEKHLSICNARETESPPYIVHNINMPYQEVKSVRKPLSEVPAETVKLVIDKVNALYEKYIEGSITVAPEREIHPIVLPEFLEEDRGESSRRHLRQASRLLQLAEDARLVEDGTCYVELGAGKGQLSYYMCGAWCSEAASRVVLVDRAALRHKRDNKLRARTARRRLRADLAHLALARVPDVERCAGVVGFAKHLCGVATDYALWCLTAEGTLEKTRGGVLATCCHHRCELASYVAVKQLQELGITEDEFNVILGIVSWATCGDGRSRERRRLELNANDFRPQLDVTLGINHRRDVTHEANNQKYNLQGINETVVDNNVATVADNVATVADNVATVADNVATVADNVATLADNVATVADNVATVADNVATVADNVATVADNVATVADNVATVPDNVATVEDNVTTVVNSNIIDTKDVERRAEYGRRAKLVLDWGRVLFLKSRGLNARLCRYVPSTVSLENICIIATRPDR